MSYNLSPPWYTLQREFANTIGLDPAVTVEDLKEVSAGHYLLRIVVNDENKGTALRTIVPINFAIGNINVVTEIQNSKGEMWAARVIGDDKQVLKVLTDAFTGNPIFVAVKERVLPPDFKQAGLIITRTVTQFFNDDLSDFFSNYNSVTADTVSKLIRMDYPIPASGRSVSVVMGTAEK